mmetsp:Transcript_1412/g.5530  ORF Transcript_1412/g.5530 Transcript_1412/m.5530 type:complete len:213 (-) Transcript_1412:745-1383(-)
MGAGRVVTRARTRGDPRASRRLLKTRQDCVNSKSFSSHGERSSSCSPYSSRSTASKSSARRSLEYPRIPRSLAIAMSCSLVAVLTSNLRSHASISEDWNRRSSSSRSISSSHSASSRALSFPSSISPLSLVAFTCAAPSARPSCFTVRSGGPGIDPPGLGRAGLASGSEPAAHDSRASPPRFPALVPVSAFHSGFRLTTPGVPSSSFSSLAS